MPCTNAHIKLQAPQASLTWNECAKLPTQFSIGKAAFINGKVYCGGVWSDNDDDEYIVYCYDPSQNKWTTLPPLPVKWFGLGQIDGKLVTVGGKKNEHRATNEVYTFEERS